MKRLIKFTFALIAVCIFLVVIGVGVLATVISPNKFKPLISAQLLKHTGYEVVIDGNLAWSFYPSLGISVGHTLINNPSGFSQKPFAEIAQATVSVKLLPLLHGKVESDGVILAGVKLNLLKNANGQANWIKTTEKPTLEQHSGDSSGAMQAGGLTLAVSKLSLKDATIILDDQQAQQHIEIRKLQLHATDIHLDKPFPIDSNFIFAVKAPAANGELNLKGMLDLGLEDKEFSLKDTVLKIKMLQNNHSQELIVNGDTTINLLKQTLQITHLKSQLGNLILNGEVNVNELTTHPRVVGHLQAPPFDLKQLLQGLGYDAASLQAANHVEGDVDFNTVPAASLSAGALSTVDVQAKVKIAQLKAAKLTLDKISINAKLHDGVLALTPFSAQLYQGTLQGKANVNLVGSSPQTALQADLANIQVEPLLADLGSADSQLKLKGAANVNLDVMTTGMSGEAVMHNLNGSGRFSMLNGKVEGIDIGYWVDSALAMVQKQTNNAQNTQTTNFGSLNGTVTIRNGVVSNQDLYLDSPQFDTKGQGDIDLVSQRIDYSLKTVSKQAAQNKAKNILNVYNLTIPLQISGELKKPSISLDAGDLLRQVAAQQAEHIRDQVKDKLKDRIKKELPGQAGELLQNLLGQ